MFKDGVNLKKNAWYIKFMHFMWGATYEDFPNLCPLFWAVIGSITIFPFWCLWKVIAFVFSLGGNLIWDQVKRPLGWFAMGFWYWLTAFLISILITVFFNGFIAKLFDGGSWHGYLVHLAIAGLILLAIIAAIFLIYVFVVYSSHVSSVTKKTIHYNSAAAQFLDSWFVMLPYYIIRLIYWPFKGIFKGIGELFKLIGGFLYYDVYKKNCPFITWEE